MKRPLFALLLSSWLVGCRGSDSCEGAACGKPSRCSAGQTCADAPPDPWYVYIGDDLGDEPLRLFGIRQSELGLVPPVELSAGVATEEHLGPTFHAWSPDGRFLVFDLTSADFRSELHFVELGSGSPNAAAALPDLPVSDGWSSDVRWSARGDTAVVQEGSDFFWLDFRAEGPSASALDPEDAPAEVWPCADGESVVYETEESGAFVMTVASPGEAEALGAGEVVVSPDGARFALFSPTGLVLSECGAGGERTTVDAREIEEPAAELAWSPDSRFLAYSVPSPDEETYELHVVDVTGEAEPWTATAADGEARWDTRSARLVFAPESSEELSVAAFPGGEIAPLDLPAGTYESVLHPSGVSYAVRDEETDEVTAWLRLDGASEPLLLEGCGASTVVFDEGPTAAVCVEETDEGSSYLAFMLDDDGALSRTRLHEPAPELLTVHEFAPDGSGFVGARSAFTDEPASTLVWVPAPFEAGAPLVAINQGTLGYGPSFQPVTARVAR